MTAGAGKVANHPPDLPVALTVDGSAGGDAIPAPVESGVGLRGRAARRRARSRAVALGDQVLSGLSNFLAVALVARSDSPDAFGRFALVYALFVAIMGLGRRWWGTRISMTAGPAESLDVLRRLLAAILYATLPAVCVMAVLSLVFAGIDALPIVGALAVALPIVLAQDLCRYGAVAAGRPAAAAASDLVWVVIVAVGYVLRPSMPVALAFWVGGAVAALVVALVALRIGPRWSAGWSSLWERHPTSEVSALASAASTLATYATLGMAAVALGSAAAGSLRGASSVMAPVNTVSAFVGLAMLSVGFRTPVARQGRFVARVSLALIGLSLLWGAVLLALPTAVGHLLLGDSWDGARTVLPWTVLEYVGLAVIAGVALGFQAAQSARLLAAVSLAEAGLVLLGSGVALHVATSASAFAAALAVAALVSAAGAAVLYGRVLGRPRPASHPAPGGQAE